MNKKLITSAVASAVALPTAAFAAIDDQGMAYVTAAEGLHGSLRMDLLIDTDEDDRDASTETNSLRMWVNGTADLGGGLQSTYYWEFRGNEGGGTDVQSNAWDIGLKGAFGEIEFGKLAMSSFRLVPSASLAFERGSERESPGADTKDGGWRYESPVINGFQFGISGILNGANPGEIEFEEVVQEQTIVEYEPSALAVQTAQTITLTFTASTITLVPGSGNASKISSNPTTGNPDGSLDEFAIAVKYTMPIGLEIGAAYESVKNGKGKQVLDISDDEIDVVADLKDREDSQGYRFGMRYGQDNWLLAYEYRTYDSFVPSDFHNPGEDYFGAIVQLKDNEEAVLVELTSGEKDVDYQVHAFGVQAKLDRITMSANYSIDEVELQVDLDGGTSNNPVQKSKYAREREVIALDAAYALGSRTNIVLGWKQQEFEHKGRNASRNDNDVATTYVFYRVDF